MFSIMKSSKWCFLVSAAIILIGVVCLIVNGGFATDIDFSGGCKMVVDTTGATTTDEAVIKKAVENMTGLKVLEVNVHVQGVHAITEKEEKTENTENAENNEENIQ